MNSVASGLRHTSEVFPIHVRFFVASVSVVKVPWDLAASYSRTTFATIPSRRCSLSTAASGSGQQLMLD